MPPPTALFRNGLGMNPLGYKELFGSSGDQLLEVTGKDR